MRQDKCPRCEYLEVALNMAQMEWHAAADEALKLYEKNRMQRRNFLGEKIEREMQLHQRIAQLEALITDLGCES